MSMMSRGHWQTSSLHVVGEGSWKGPHRAAKHHVGILLLYSLGNHLEALFEDGGDDVFVADAYIT
jgi:hypothetical protein